MSIWPTFCDTVTFRGSAEEPPESCHYEPIPGTDKCRHHTDETDPDSARDWANEQAMEQR